MPSAGQAPANRVELDGLLRSSEGLRYTPAGVAIVDATLEHGSQQREGAGERRIEFEVSVRFVGEAAQRVAGVALGSGLRVRGFLAARRRQSRQLVLHVNQFELIEV
jgi:primosomal replication protein N